MFHPLRIVGRLVLLLPPAILALGLKAENPSDPKTQIEKLEQTMAMTLERNDPAGFAQFLASDWRMVDDNGDIKTREEVLQPLNAGVIRFEHYSVAELDIRIYGDSAVAIGADEAKGASKGENFSTQSRFTDVFAKAGGLWHLVSTAESP